MTPCSDVVGYQHFGGLCCLPLEGEVSGQSIAEQSSSLLLSPPLWGGGHCQPTRGGPPALRLGEGRTIPHYKKLDCYEMLHRASKLIEFFGTT
jgi:hypothetical protein